ncbi:LacI family DNA-binding transcriptional regulator [Paenibacillus sp. GCM10027626]|uniref:LacI family DNA-binding transcriptional regulator n=1 Tax=Paenibacillus sp. GCM10027626 TaxID=3273411 RepID=UPI00362DC83E
MSIHEIARRAGVSIATVSYALNNKGNVSSQKRELIARIAEELNYVPNSLAKGLLSKKTSIIGLIVPDISMPYTLALIRYLELHARENELFLLLGHTDGNMKTLMGIVDSFISKNVDALIIATGSDFSEADMSEAISHIEKFKVPSILISPSHHFQGMKMNYVIPDLEEGEYQITRFLLANGHRQLLYVGGERHNFVTEIRRRGFVRALEAAGIEVQEDQYRDCGYTFQDGYCEIIRFLESGSPLPSAFVAINDSVALGIYKGLKERGIRVPEDVSLVGYDDIELPTLDFIPMTTVKIPVAEMSRLCMDGLMRYWEGQNFTFQYSLKPELVIRDSVKILPE